jgi:hypothetical protein
MYEAIIDETGATGKINFDGSMMIQEILPVKESFLNSINKTESLIVNHGKVTSFDLSYLQLLIALHKSASSQNKGAEVEEKHPESFLQLMRESGCPFYKWLNISPSLETERGED